MPRPTGVHTAAAADEDKRRENGKMKKICMVLFLAAAIAALTIMPAVAAGTPAPAQGGQKTFTTPDEAIRVLIEACRTNNEQKLIELIGAENKDLIKTNDRAHDTYTRKKLHGLSLEKLTRVNKGTDRIILEFGKLQFPFPFPLVKGKSGWYYDGVAGREEIINRRVGRDELNAIAACRLYVKAQKKYAALDRDRDDVIEYAQKFASSPGKRDGLFWPADPSKKEELSPLGPVLAESKKYASLRKQGEPFHGYYFRILTKQGDKAPGGAYDYVINGNMVAGFALIAYPSDYGISGIMTFIVGPRGKVYQKDLGRDTLKVAEEMNDYNPDKSWSLVQENGTLATY